MNPLAPILSSFGLSADFGPALTALGIFAVLFFLYNSIVVGGGNGDGASANMLSAFMASLMTSGMKLVPQDSGEPKKG